MPTDVPKDPAYWKVKDEDLHEMHKEIAARYCISRDDCLWLENLVDDTNLYVFNKHLKPIVNEALKPLSEAEEKSKKNLLDAQ